MEQVILGKQNRFGRASKKMEVGEHHIGVYASKTDEYMIKARPSENLVAWEPGIPIFSSRNHRRKVCECSAALSIGTGIPALWYSDYKAKHGELVYPFWRGIFMRPLRLSS